MLLCTYQSLDYLDKPDLSEEDKIPNGLFRNDVGKGVAWCMPITENFSESVVNSWMSCPNFAQHFLIIDTDDFHKIDKIRWYKDIANGCNKNFWEYIDDGKEDMFSEYVVPYSEIREKCVAMFSPMCLGLTEDYDAIKYVAKVDDKNFAFLNREIFPVASDVFNHYVPPDLCMTDFDTEEEQLDVQRQVQTIMFHVFSLFYVPMIFTLYVNLYFHKAGRDKENSLGYLRGWELYVRKFLSRYREMQDKYASWSRDKNQKVEDFISIRNGFLDFFRYNDMNITNARLKGLGRNESCPCGSGKKFKKCCGKGYC